MKKNTMTIETYMAEKRSDVVQADPRSLKIVEGLNGREDYGDIEELKGEIRTVGKILNNSIGFRKDGVIHIINGHRRNRAAIELLTSGEMPELRQPITVLKGIPTELEMIQIMLLSNRGKNFTPLEDANTMLRMATLGSTPKQIADAYFKTEAHVCNSLALAKLPARLKQRIQSNDISSTLVLNIVRGNKEMTVEEIADKVETVLAKYKGSNQRITAKVMDKELNKVNSVSILKQLLKDTPAENIGNKDLYNTLTALVGGQLTAEDIAEMLQVKEAVEA